MWNWFRKSPPPSDEISPDGILIESDAMDLMSEFGYELSDWFDERCYDLARQEGPFDGQHPLVTAEVVARVKLLVQKIIGQSPHPPGVG